MPCGIGFTGTWLGCSPGQLATLEVALRYHFRPGATFHHGCCQGADIQAAALAQQTGYRVVAHPGPAGRPSAAPEAAWCAQEIRPRDSHFSRNRAIVDGTIHLLACPLVMQPSSVRGTWYTIGYAKRKGKPFTIIWPKGVPFHVG